MSDHIDEIFDSLTEDEVSELLKELPSKKTDGKTSRRIYERTMALAGHDKAAKGGSRASRIAVRIAAAALVLVVAGGIAVYAVKAEAKEYEDAERFFTENGLDTEGLTRAEIKAVYRDITTESFTYGKTAEVIAHSLETSSVAGFEINSEPKSPEEVMAAWHELREAWQRGEDRREWTGGVYPWQLGYSASPVHPEGSLENIAMDVKKTEDNKEIWSVRLDGFASCDLKVVTGGVIAYGRSAGKDRRRPMLAKVSGDGELLWRRDALLDCGCQFISAITELYNGDIAVFGAAEADPQEDPDGYPVWNVCYARYTADGEPIHTNTAIVGGGSVSFAVPYGDGCIAAIDFDGIFTVSGDGSFSEKIVYSESDRHYVIKSMIEYAGSVFISCYSYPEAGQNGEGFFGYSEMPGVRAETDLDGIEAWYNEHPNWREDGFGYCDETFLSTLRENYGAVLLRVGPVSPEPEIFYSVGAAFGSRLEISDEGELVWYVESISSAGIYPQYDSHGIEILCAVSLCRFAPSGEIIAAEDTGEITRIWR